jgi:hypothetical protein
MSKLCVLGVALVCAAMVAPVSSQAQLYPSRPIQVENRLGGAGRVAIEAVAQPAPKAKAKSEPTRSVAAAASGPPVSPHPHRHRLLKYLGSTKPIPEAHAYCVLNLDQQHLRRFQRSETLKNPEKKALMQKALAITVRTDWGVIPRDKYFAGLREAEKNLQEALDDVKETRGDVRYWERKHQEALDTAKRTGGVGAGIAANLVATTRDMLEEVREQVVFEEDWVDHVSSFIAYMKCAVANNLPPTIEQ